MGWVLVKNWINKKVKLERKFNANVDTSVPLINISYNLDF